MFIRLFLVCLDNVDEQTYIQVSALTGQGLDELRQAVAGALGASGPVEVLLTPGEGRLRSWLYECGAVLGEQINEDGSMALTLVARDDVLKSLQRRAVRPAEAN